MLCPVCGEDDNRVWYTREIDDGLKRLRICKHCGARFITVEKISPVPHMERQTIPIVG